MTGPGAQPPHDPSHDDQRNNDGANLIVLVAVILLVVGTVALLLALKHGIALQDCLFQGRHNCDPVDTSGSQ